MPPPCRAAPRGSTSHCDNPLQMPLPIAAEAGWHFQLGPLILLVPITVAYVHRWRAVQAHPGRLVTFLLGIATATVALMSPIDPLGDELFTMHMVQHLLLLDVAPVLVLLGLTKPIFRPATKRVIQLEQRASWLMSPKTGLLVYVAGMWVWHWPGLYNAAVTNSTVHVLEHVTFSVIGGLYWWHLISPVRDQRRLSGMGAVLYMATTKVLVGILGIALTFMPRAIYDVYVEQDQPWGLTALEDQRIGGVLMATEQSIIMGVALVWLFVTAIDRSEREQRRKERFGDRDEGGGAPPADPQRPEDRPPALY